jgi:hypothetical protein
MENKEELELLKMLAEAEEDVRNGKVSSIESTFYEIRKKLNTFASTKTINNKKYMRIQGEELAYKTKKPVGVFVLTWRRVRDGIYSEEDKNTYLEVDKWFKENLPEPPFYGDNNDNPLGATTWFKTNNCNGMLEHIKPLLDLLDKYKVPYEIAYSDNPGKIIYEDDYQIGVIDYDKEEKYELLKMLSESEDDVKNGRLSSIENTFSDNRKKLG